MHWNIRVLLVGLAMAFLLSAAAGWFCFHVTPGATAQFDTAGRRSVHAIAGPVLTKMMVAASLAGKPIVLWIAALVIAAVFWRYRKKAAAESIVIAMTGASALELGLKLLFQRKRPEAYFGYALPSSYSFPSGHALYSLCFFSILALAVSPLLTSRMGARLAWCAAIAAALIIGISRIYLGVHYPTDVLGGYASAAVWIFAVAHGNRYRSAGVQ